MKLGWLARPEAASPIFLGASYAPRGCPELSINLGEERVYQVSELEKLKGSFPFWALCADILEKGRSLRIEMLRIKDEQWPEPDERLELLQSSGMPLALRIFTSWRDLSGSSDTNIIVLEPQATRAHGTELAQQLGRRLVTVLRTAVACHKPAVDNTKPGSLRSFAELDRLHQKNDAFFDAKTHKPVPDEKRIMYFDDLDGLAEQLGMSKLDAFLAARTNAPRASNLTWGKAREMFAGCRLPTTGSDCLPINSESLLEQALQPENAAKLIPETNDRENFCHVILRGSSGTGKTSLGQLIFLNELSRDETSRIVYMGPTRMLVEERWKLFKKEAETFAGTPLAIAQEDIVISTGEIRENDERIARGDFRILFIVYEKLNHFFHYSEFTPKISCVLVDEVQMIADAFRGGILEIILVHLCREAQQRMLDRKKPLRIIICTTEAFNLDDMLTLRVHINGIVPKLHPPLELTDTRRPIPPVTLWQYFGKTMQSKPVNLGLKTKRETSNGVTSWMTTPCLMPGKRDRVAWLQEWLWGRKKVLYISPNILDKLQIAEALLPSRTPIIDDTAWLENYADGLRSTVDKKFVERVVACAEKGIFFYFTEMGAASRLMAADKYCDLHCDQPILAFATSAVTYGVNLPADLLLLENSDAWPTKESKNFGPGAVIYRPLSASQLHNLVGRVGRMGLYDTSLKPVIVICNQTKSRTKDIYEKAEQNLAKMRKLLSSPESELKTNVFARGHSNFKQWSDFTQSEQIFLLNVLLHLWAETGEAQTQKEILGFIQSSWSGKNLSQDIWKEIIRVFYRSVEEEFTDILSIKGEGEKCEYLPGPLLRSICETATPLMSLRELNIILRSWGDEKSTDQLCTLVILSLALTSETWAQFLEFHQESQEKFKSLDEAKQGEILAEVATQEGEARERLFGYLCIFMSAENARRSLKTFQKLFEDTGLGIERSYGLAEYMKPKIACILFRTVCALFAWCLGEEDEKININHYADGKIPQGSGNAHAVRSIFLPENLRSRMYYTLSTVYEWSKTVNLSEWQGSVLEVKNAIRNRNLLDCLNKAN